MSYIVYARKWRPQRFDEVVGQEHITTTLKNAIAQDRVAHAYIFCGPRGIGKTTTARILAKALNCKEALGYEPCNKCSPCKEISEGRSLDVIEIDGASNRGIEEVRQLRENVKFGPSQGRFKIYIIDEVHMLTDPAFNALLKTLEEPPAHVKFIFATTQRHKVIATILSRCQRFDFKRIPVSGLVSKLKQIAKHEKLQIEEGALFAIAKAAGGSMRDAESVLDQLASFCQGKIGVSDVVSVLGTVEQQILYDITQRIIERDSAGSLEMLNSLMDEGKDIPQLLVGLLEHFRNLVIAKVAKDPPRMIDLPKEDIEMTLEQGKNFTIEDLLYIFNVLSKTQESIKRSSSMRVLLEMALVKLAKRQSLVSFEELLQNLSELEKKIESLPEPNPGCSSGPEPHGPQQTEPHGPQQTEPHGPQQAEPHGPQQAEPHGPQQAEPRPFSGSEHNCEPPLGRREPSSTQGESETDIPGPAEKQQNVRGQDIRPEPDLEPLPQQRDIRPEPDLEPSPQQRDTLDKIKEIWPRLLERIKSEKISAALFLSEGRPIQVEGAMVTIGFPARFSFYSEALERPENKKLVERCLQQELQKALRVKLVVVHLGDGKFGATSEMGPVSEGGQGPPGVKANFAEGENLGGGPSAGQEDMASEEEISEDNGSSSFRPSQLLTEPIIQSALKIFKGQIIKKDKDLKSRGLRTVKKSIDRHT